MRVSLLLLATALACQAAETSCPWLNNATAEGILNGAVTQTFTPSSKTNDDGLCRFVTQRGSLADTLTIEVTTMPDPPKDYAAYLVRCGANPVHLRGIGNDAIVCPAKVTQAEIISRIRNRALVVQTTAGSPKPDRNELERATHTAAELASGNLF